MKSVGSVNVVSGFGSEIVEILSTITPLYTYSLKPSFLSTTQAIRCLGENSDRELEIKPHLFGERIIWKCEYIAKNNYTLYTNTFS